MTPKLIEAVDAETARAKAKHGPLTTNPYRAYAILAEESGEVARALLEYGRRQRAGVWGGAERRAAITELVQLISVSSLLIENLDLEGELK